MIFGDIFLKLIFAIMIFVITFGDKVTSIINTTVFGGMY